MKYITWSVIYHIGTWKVNFRVLAALLLGCGITLTNIGRYFSFAHAVGYSVQIFEPYILTGSNVMFFMGILLGCLLLLSDAPFVTPMSKYEIIRIGRKKWLMSQIVYIIIACIVYSIVILLFSVAVSTFAGDFFLSNHWSQTMVMLAERQPGFADNFRLSFKFPDYIRSTKPFTALLLTFLYNNLYMVVMGLCMFVFNLLINRNAGWVAAMALHIVGYIIYANAGFGIVSVKYSLLCCAAPGFHYVAAYGISNSYSFMLFAAIVLFLIFAGISNASRLELFYEAAL